MSETGAFQQADVLKQKFIYAYCENQLKNCLNNDVENNR